jgi:hypothetical protein
MFLQKHSALLKLQGDTIQQTVLFIASALKISDWTVISYNLVIFNFPSSRSL